MTKLIEQVGLGIIVFLIIEVMVSKKSFSKPGVSKVPKPRAGKRDDKAYVFDQIKSMFGPEIAKSVEQMYRLETANFTSMQYRVGRSAGQHAHSRTFPYGWTSMERLWLTNPSIAPIGFDPWKKDSGGTPVEYLVFPDLFSGAVSLAEFLKKYDNNVGRWFSTKPENQKLYASKVRQQPVKYK